jgi:DNA-binding transcriptional LysR family regulator
MAYTSSSLAGIQAAVAAGVGLSILSEVAIQADHRVLTARDGSWPIDRTEAALVTSPEAPRRCGSPSPRRILQYRSGQGGLSRIFVVANVWTSGELRERLFWPRIVDRQFCNGGGTL